MKIRFSLITLLTLACAIVRAYGWQPITPYGDGYNQTTDDNWPVPTTYYVDWSDAPHNPEDWQTVTFPGQTLYPDMPFINMSTGNLTKGYVWTGPGPAPQYRHRWALVGGPRHCIRTQHKSQLLGVQGRQR